jgi:hypothetical protein
VVPAEAASDGAGEGLLPRLAAALFAARLSGHVPVVHLRLPPEALAADVGDALRTAFARHPTPSGDPHWPDAVRAALRPWDGRARSARDAGRHDAWAEVSDAGEAAAPAAEDCLCTEDAATGPAAPAPQAADPPRLPAGPAGGRSHPMAAPSQRLTRRRRARMWTGAGGAALLCGAAATIAVLSGAGRGPGAASDAAPLGAPPVVAVGAAPIVAVGAPPVVPPSAAVPDGDGAPRPGAAARSTEEVEPRAGGPGARPIGAAAGLAAARVVPPPALAAVPVVAPSPAAVEAAAPVAPPPPRRATRAGAGRTEAAAGQPRRRGGSAPAAAAAQGRTAPAAARRPSRRTNR